MSVVARLTRLACRCERHADLCTDSRQAATWRAHAAGFTLAALAAR